MNETRFIGDIFQTTNRLIYLILVELFLFSPPFGLEIATLIAPGRSTFGIFDKVGKLENFL